MTVGRKLFVAMASFIIAMGLLFSFVTQFVVRGMLENMLDVDRSKEMKGLSTLFVDYYQKHGDSWDGIRQVNINKTDWNSHEKASFVLLSLKHKQLYKAGDASYGFITNLGIRQNVQLDGKTIAFLYYYDREVGNIRNCALV